MWFSCLMAKGLFGARSILFSSFAAGSEDGLVRFAKFDMEYFPRVLSLKESCANTIANFYYTLNMNLGKKWKQIPVDCLELVIHELRKVRNITIEELQKYGFFMKVL